MKNPIEIQKQIEATGHSILGVDKSASKPSYAYTIGVSETYRHPELIVLGLATASAEQILGAVVEKIKGGEILANGDVVSDAVNMRLGVKDLIFTRKVFGWTRGVVSH